MAKKNRVIEIRAIGLEPSSAVETRVGEKVVRGFEGYGTIYVEQYPMYGRSLDDCLWCEQLAHGSATQTLKLGRAGGFLVLHEHNRERVIASTASGRAIMEEDEKGLRFSVPDIGEAQWINDLWLSVRDGDISGASFAFRVIKEEWEERDDKPPLRTITEIALDEQSIVARGANPVAFSGVRSLAGKEARGVAQSVMERSGIEFDFDKIFSDAADTEEPGVEHLGAGDDGDKAIPDDSTPEPDDDHLEAERAARQGSLLLRARGLLLTRK